MKLKHIVTALTPMLILAACSDDEMLLDGSNGKIRFTSTIGNNSRSEEATTANLQEFNVTALNQDASIGLQDGIYFQNVKVKKNGNTWATEGGDYYWGSYPLSFYSWTTHHTQNTTTTYTNGWPTKATVGGASNDYPQPTITINKSKKRFENVVTPFTTNAVYDFLIARNPNVALPTTDPYSIPIHFEHAFATVQLYIKGTSTNNKYYVQQTVIGNLYSNGTLSIERGFTTAAGKGTQLLQTDWTTLGDRSQWWLPQMFTDAEKKIPMNFVGGTTSASQISALAKVATDEIYIIPQATKPWDKTSEIITTNADDTKTFNNWLYVGIQMAIYQKQSPTDTEFKTKIFPKTADAADGAIKVGALYAPIPLTAFEPNKKYVLVADITNGGTDNTGKDQVFKINFSVTVQDLGTGTTTTITF